MEDEFIGREEDVTKVALYALGPGAVVPEDIFGKGCSYASVSVPF